MTEQKTVRVVAAEIHKEGQFLITQRRPSAVFPLLWEFPSGKVEPGETDEEALKREILERLGVEIAIDGLSMELHHDYEDYGLDFVVYSCRLLSENLQKLRVNDWRFVAPSELDQYQFPAADFQTVQRLLYPNE